MRRLKTVICVFTVMTMLTGFSGMAYALTFNPTLPSVPMHPLQPTEPLEPVKPVTPVVPVEPVVPLDPVVPLEPVEPLDPLVPAEGPIDCDSCNMSLYAMVENNVVKLTWTLSWDPDTWTKGFRIYRTSDDNTAASVPLTDFDLTGNSYTDSNIVFGIPYKYVIKPVFADGTEGKASNEVNVQIDSPGTTVSLQIDNPMINVNGAGKEIDPGRGIKPVIINGRTYVPVRAVTESFGAVLAWNADEQKVTIDLDGVRQELKIGSNIISTVEPGCALCTPKQITMDVAPVIQNGRTLLPIRFIADGFGWSTAWEGKTRTVTIVKQANAKVWPANFIGMPDGSFNPEGNVIRPEGGGEWTPDSNTGILEPDPWTGLTGEGGGTIWGN